MTEAFRVPKQKVPVEVVLAGRSPLLLNIYLSECAESHGGRERPSEVLDDKESFLPASDDNGNVVFIHRDGLISVSFEARHEFDSQTLRPEDLPPEHRTCIEVEVMLEDGLCIVGKINYIMPEGQRRLQDVLNLPKRFLILRVDDRAHLINIRRIIRVSSVPESDEAAHGAHR